MVPPGVAPPGINRTARVAREVAAARAALGWTAPTALIYRNPRLKPEIHGTDTDVSQAAIIATTSTNASSFVLNLVQAGNGSWNRKGRKIKMLTLRLKGTFDITVTPTFATGAMNTNLVTMRVVWDKQPSSGTIPTYDTIFGITAQDGTESCPDVMCPPRYDNMGRFKVLLDRNYGESAMPFFIPAFGTAPSNIVHIPCDEFLKLKLPETVFSGQSAPMTIADISSGALYLYFRTQFNVAATTAAFDGIARLRFLDI